MSQREISLAKFYMGPKAFVEFCPMHPCSLTATEQVEQLETILHNKWAILNIGDKLKNIFLYDHACIPVIEELFVDITDTQLCSNFVVAPFKAALLSFPLSYNCRMRCFANMLRDSADLFTYFEDEIDKLLNEPLQSTSADDFCRFAEVFALASEDMSYAETTALIFERVEELFTHCEPTIGQVARIANYCIYITRGTQSVRIGPGFFRFMLRICESLGVSERCLEQSFAGNPSVVASLLDEGLMSRYVDWWRRRIISPISSQGSFVDSNFEINVDSADEEFASWERDVPTFLPNFCDCFGQMGVLHLE